MVNSREAIVRASSLPSASGGENVVRAERTYSGQGEQKEGSQLMERESKKAEAAAITAIQSTRGHKRRTIAEVRRRATSNAAGAFPSANQRSFSIEFLIENCTRPLDTQDERNAL